MLSKSGTRGKRSRKGYYILAALALICGLFFLWPIRRPRTIASTLGPPVTISIAAKKLNGSEPSKKPSAQKLDATRIDGEEAKRLLVLALSHLFNARSYKSVMTTTSLSGNGTIKFYSSVTLQHLKSPTRGDLFRCDILNFSGPADNFSPETMKLEPATTRTEITNDEGNWDFGDEIGKEGKAFHLTGSEVPLETVDMHRSFQQAAQQLENDPDPGSFTVTNENDRGTAVVAIAYAAGTPNPYNSTYLIDPDTGDLRTIVGGGIRRDFDLSAPIDEAEFTVPPSLTVTPVEDQDALRRYQRDHSNP